MTERPGSLPEDVDLERPNAARMYDYYLGGGANFSIDREAAKKALEAVPSARRAAIENRAFLRRAVEFCVAAGVRQFIDLGSGIPTAGNTHEVAQALDPSCRVVYVDHEAIAAAHARHLLQNAVNAVSVRRDLLDVDLLLADDAVRGLLDFEEPVGVMMISVLHFVPDGERLDAAMRGYLGAVVPGSHLCISHGTYEVNPERMAKAADAYRNSATPVTLRTRDEVTELFAGTEIVDPGVVLTPLWRPASPEDVGENPEQALAYAGVGRKP